MILRHWMDCPHTTFGRLREWRIFTRREGGLPNADTGAVCFDITCYGRAAVIPGVTTEPAAHEEVQGLCVSSGHGLLHAGGQAHPLRPGTSAMIPPGAEHRFANTGQEELEFVFSRRPPAAGDGELRVRHWTEDRPGSEWGTSFQGHWVHTYRGPSCEVHIADLPPRKLSHPHNHPEGLDEIWYVRAGRAWHWMAKDYRAHGPGWALWLEPGELHSLMNPTDENVEYIYATSAALLYERLRGQGQEEPEPATAAAAVAQLEERFGELAAAYRRTDLGIHGISANLPRIEALLAKLKELT